LFDGLAHKGDDDVVGKASLAGTVVVHDVAETQRTLVHSDTPTARHYTVIVHTLARPAGFPEGLQGDGRVHSKVRLDLNAAGRGVSCRSLEDSKFRVKSASTGEKQLCKKVGRLESLKAGSP
jgi:hypothetical protein